MSEARKYQPVSTKSPRSAIMKEQEGVDEIPRDHQDGSDDDIPLPQQGFVVIDQGGDSDASSDEDGGNQMQNGGYQLLSQEPEGPEDDEESIDHSTGGIALTNTTSASATGMPSYDPEMMQQMSSLSSSSTESTSHPHLPQHLATLMPAQDPLPDQAARVSYSDTKGVRESRKQHMAEDDKIKSAMAGFKLPGASMPQWTNFVSEQDWKNNLDSGGKILGSTKQSKSKQNGNDESDSQQQDTSDR